MIYSENHSNHFYHPDHGDTPLHEHLHGTSATQNTQRALATNGWPGRSLEMGAPSSCTHPRLMVTYSETLHFLSGPLGPRTWKFQR